MKSIAVSNRPDQLRTLGSGLVAVAARVKGPDQAARALIESLKSIFADEDTAGDLVDALRARFPSELPQGWGLWETFEWDARRSPN